MAKAAQGDNQNRGAKNLETGIRSKFSFFGGDTILSDNTPLTPYLPEDIIGGSVPYVAGMEEEAVWNAASQACGSEKVHYCYTIDDGRCWYLATSSSSLASNPDSWCPLAAALPGNSEYWDKETVYLYEQEGLASAIRWEEQTNRMQVYVGPARTVLPRIQSMDANFVTINQEMADVVPWQNKTLKTEKLARATAWMILASGIITAFITIIYILGINLSSITLKPDLSAAKQSTRASTQELMKVAAKTLQNDSLKHMVRVQELLNVLGANDGTLVRYQVKNNGTAVEWEALVPQAFGKGGVPELAGAKPLPGIEEDGRVRIRGHR